jgi:hypothetical protein
MSTRYTTPGPWTTISRTNVTGYYGSRIGAVQIETGPLIDGRNGQRYEEGAHKVTVSQRPADFTGGWPRGKTFKGESAWCAAERYRDDCVQALERHAREEGL